MPIILENLKVGQIIIGRQFETSNNYNELIKIAKKQKIKVRVVEAGSKINIEKNLYFNVLWPSSKKAISENCLNNNSLICKLNYNNFSMLFTGDIEQIAEEQIASIYGKSNILNSTVLKVAHHGSKTSSTNDFLKAVKPQIALIGVGKNNTFGHPNKEVLEKIKSMGTKICRTDKEGEIIIKVNKEGKMKLTTVKTNVTIHSNINVE